MGNGYGYGHGYGTGTLAVSQCEVKKDNIPESIVFLSVCFNLN
jgi:hypothetical protein